MVVTQFPKNEAIGEGSSARCRCDFIDHAGLPIDSGIISSIKVWLTAIADDGTESPIRSEQEVKSAHGGTLGENGAFALVLSPSDTVAVGTHALQRRRMTFLVTFTGGALPFEVRFYLLNLRDIS